MRRGALGGHSKRETVNRQGEGGEAEYHHKAWHYFSGPPSPVGDLVECASPGAQTQSRQQCSAIHLSEKQVE